MYIYIWPIITLYFFKENNHPFSFRLKSQKVKARIYPENSTSMLLNNFLNYSYNMTLNRWLKKYSVFIMGRRVIFSVYTEWTAVVREVKFRWTLVLPTLYLSPSFLDCRNCLLISCVKTETGLSTCNKQTKGYF